MASGTLRDAPRFNRDGLWRHKDIGFSKHGSLTATIGYLVGRSPSGCQLENSRKNCNTLAMPS
jgi:hypothetical protein